MNPRLSGWRFPLRYSVKRIKLYISGVNTTLIVLVHPYTEETEGGSLLRDMQSCHSSVNTFFGILIYKLCIMRYKAHGQGIEQKKRTQRSQKYF